MPGTYRMGDATAANLLPFGLDVTAGYVDGYRQDYAEVVQAWPLTKHVAINAGHVDRELTAPFDVLDMESGAFGPADFPVFLGWWRPLNTALPAGYASASNVAGFIAAAGRPRNQYLVWSAHYTNVPHVCTSATCAPASPIPWQADGTQFTDHGGVWDESQIFDYWFGDNVPLTPADIQEIVTALGQPGALTATIQAELVETIQPELVQLTAYVKELIGQLDQTVQPELLAITGKLDALLAPKPATP